MGEGDFDWLAFGAGFGVALLLALLFRWRRARRHTDYLSNPPRAPVSLTDLTPELRKDIVRMKAEGRTIEAIKLVRVRTGNDLKASKDIVDAVR